MSSKLLLHEAMAVVLIGCPDRTATIKELSLEIERRDLYRKRDGGFAQPGQIRLRATKSNGAYHHLFEWIESDKVRLRNS